MVDPLDKLTYRDLQAVCKRYNAAFEKNRMNCRNKKTTLRGVLKRARIWSDKKIEGEITTQETKVTAKAFQRFKGDLCGEKAPHGQVPRVSKAYVKSFKPVNTIGQGVYGNVQKVQKGKQTYALKTFYTDHFPALRKDRRLQTSLSKTKQTLENEMALLSKVQHPNIVRYCQAFYSESGVGHILMDFVSGPTLLQAATSHSTRQRQTNFGSYATQLFSALVYLHKNGVAHLDIKPDNIVIAYEGTENRPVLVDFGMSCTQKMVDTFGPEPQGACVYSHIPNMTIHPYYDLNLNIEGIIDALKHLEVTDRLQKTLDNYTPLQSLIHIMDIIKQKLYAIKRAENVPAEMQDFQRSDVFGLTRSLIDYALGQTLGTYAGWSDDRFFILSFLVHIMKLEKEFTKALSEDFEPLIESLDLFSPYGLEFNWEFVTQGFGLETGTPATSSSMLQMFKSVTEPTFNKPISWI